MHNQTAKNDLKVKKINLPQMMFFLEKQLMKFSCTYWPLSFCKILKNKKKRLLELILSYEDVPLMIPKQPICPKQNFLVQTIVITEGMHPPSSLGRGGSKFQKSLYWGVRNFYFRVGGYIVGGRGKFVGGGVRNFEIKIKTG